MNVLIACEESQIICKAFRLKGHNAFSCDIQECSGGHPEWHIKHDVLPLLNGKCVFYTMDNVFHYISKWDFIIAHPPCTYMSKAGARWMYLKAGILNQDRLDKALAAKNFFLTIFNADCDRIVIENPIPLKIVGLPCPSQKIQPYQFGHPYSKCTCLWFKGDITPLKPTNILDNFVPYLPSNTGGFSRGKGGSRGISHDPKTSSKTFDGVAAAMAEQWG